MRVKDAKNEIGQALKNVTDELAGNGAGQYGRGLSPEGYAGGYAQALRDVLLLLEGHVRPNTRTYWRPSAPVKQAPSEQQ